MKGVIELNDVGIDIEIDGVYCPKCNDLHPTLMWHKKYNDYLNKDEWIQEYKEALLRFKLEISDTEAIERYYEHIEALDIIQKDYSGECIVCSTLTSFINKKTGNFVCSDECKYKDNETKI